MVVSAPDARDQEVEQIGTGWRGEDGAGLKAGPAVTMSHSELSECTC